MSTPPNHPNHLTIEPLAMGEVATHKADGDVVLADSGATLLHAAYRGGCVHIVLNPREARVLAVALLAAARDGRRRQRRGV